MSVYILVHSISTDSETKPYFRIVAVEQTNLPSHFTAYNGARYEYFNVLVNTLVLPVVGEWNIKLEAEKTADNSGVQMIGYSENLTTVGQSLVARMKADADDKRLVPDQYDSKYSNTGNPCMYFAVQETLLGDDALLSLEEPKFTYHWWEIIQVKLTWVQFHSEEFNTRARLEYDANAVNIIRLSIIKETSGLNEAQEKELEETRRKIGYTNLDKEDFERVVWSLI